MLLSEVFLQHAAAPLSAMRKASPGGALRQLDVSVINAAFQQAVHAVARALGMSSQDILSVLPLNRFNHALEEVALAHDALLKSIHARQNPSQLGTVIGAMLDSALGTEGFGVGEALVESVRADLADGSVQENVTVLAGRLTHFEETLKLCAILIDADEVLSAHWDALCRR